jgi:hypothetical protein
MKHNYDKRRVTRFYVIGIRVALFIALGVGSVWGPVFWRVVFLLLFSGYTALTVRLADQAQTVEMIRHYRHRYANHLQIISGWMELHKPDKAADYITQRALLSVQPSVFRGLPMRWIHRMMALNSSAEAAGQEIRWEHPERNPGTYMMLWKLSAVLREVISASSGIITVKFEERGFYVVADGIMPGLRKHIIGVQWEQNNNRVTASWGMRQ